MLVNRSFFVFQIVPLQGETHAWLSAYFVICFGDRPKGLDPSLRH